MNLFDFFEEQGDINPVTFNPQDGECIYHESFIKENESDLYFKLLLEKIKWEQQEMNMYGKKILFPRLTSWYGDTKKSYSFSGITLAPNVWTSELLELKNKIESECQHEFNSVLLNLYRGGDDSISWHTDAEKELGNNPIIASLTFGETRKFQLRHKETKEKKEFMLSDGSLLIMKGKLQQFWEHQIPKTKKKIGKRINLTFRFIK